MDNNQRLLKIVNTEDNGEVTIVLQPDQAATLTRHGQEGSRFLRQAIGSLQNPVSTSTQPSSNYQPPAQPIFGPYQSTSNSQNSQYQASQQLLSLRQLQQEDSKTEGQGSNFQILVNQNKPALSSTTFVTSSSNTWNGKEYTTWAPKLGSIKWPQEGLDLLQQSDELTESRNKMSVSESLLTSNSTSELKIKSSVPSIYPLKFSRVSNMVPQSKSMTSILPDMSSLGRVDNFPELASISNTITNVSSPVPINLSNVVLPSNLSQTQSGYNVGNDVKPLYMNSTGYVADASGTGSTASPVYKSKLEKAVEQQQQSSFMTANKTGKSSSAYASTLKKLLGGSIGDIDTLKLLQSFDWKPHIEQLVEQNSPSLAGSQAHVPPSYQPTQIVSGTQMRNSSHIGTGLDMSGKSQVNSHPEIANRLQAGLNASRNSQQNFADQQQMGVKIDQVQTSGYQDLYSGNPQQTDLKKTEFYEPISSDHLQIKDAEDIKFPGSYETSSQAKYSIIADENAALQIGNYNTQDNQTHLGPDRRQTMEAYIDQPINMGQNNQFQMGSYHDPNDQNQLAKDEEIALQSRVDKTISIGQNYQLQIESYHEQKRQTQISAGIETAISNSHNAKIAQSNVTKRVGHRSGRTLQSKKDILLDKTQADMLRMSQNQTLSLNDNTVPQQSLPNIDFLPDMNFNQLEPPFQSDVKNIDTKEKEMFEGTSQNENYQYMLKDTDYEKVGTLKDFEYQQASQPEMVYSNEFPATPSLTDIVNEGIKEKDYYTSNWGDKILNEQWRLREDGYFCDAVFFCKDKQFKFHRLVMSAVCRAFLYRNHNFSVETQLVLPVDILYENVYIFMKYVYLGHIKLTVDNVQQIYRLSSMFDVSELNTCCYHFCKLSKMGHLIISSPYQESARQIYQTQLPCKEDKDQLENQGNETQLEITDVGTIEQIADILTKKSNDQKVDTNATDIDFDWLSFDPAQSNIPIRKRARTRHKHNMNTCDNTNKKTEKLEIDKNLLSESNDLQTPGKSKHENVSNKELPVLVGLKDAKTEKGVHAENGNKDQEHLIEHEKDYTTINENALTIQFEELPDPLETGKLDETKLIKRKVTTSKVKNSVSSHDKPTRKAMVTRYRGKPKTMTVLEAALHKKAKYNMSTTSTCTKKSLREKVQSKKKLKPKNSTEANDVDTAKNEMIDDVLEAMKKDTYEKNELQNQPRSVENTSPILHESPTKSTPPKKKAISAKKRSSLSKEKIVKDTENIEEKEEKQETVSGEIHSGPSTPKKPKLRKSTIDQQQDIPLKDPVYMRPPKKRTKEIREMMKNVGDVSVDTKHESQQKFTAISAELKEKLSEGQLKSLAKARLLAEFKQKKQKKSKLLQDASILRVVYEVEQYGRVIDGEKQYKCCLCSSTFVFSKRAITHIVNTHDISLEETADYIDVEHKRPQPKKCDICGYVTKEINIYYIHFHKYFKHGVPLPKGWQPFKCDFCKKEFFTKFQLREHKLTHFEDNPFVCELCGNGFKSRTGLNSHMFHKHSSVRKHKCPDCAKSFKTRTQMKVHKRTHTGEKPYGCQDPLCTYRSTTRGNMKLHLLNRHKFTTANVEKYMKELKCSRTVASNKDFNDTSDLLEGETDAENIEEEESHLAVKIESFDDNNTAFETLVGAAAEIASSSKDFTKSELNFHQTGPSASASNGQVHTFPDEIVLQIVDNNRTDRTSQNFHPIEASKTLTPHNITRQVGLILQQNSDALHQSKVPNYGTPFSAHQIQLNTNVLVSDCDNLVLSNTSNHNQQLKSQEMKIIYPSPKEETAMKRNEKTVQIDPHSKEAEMIVKPAIQVKEEKLGTTFETHSSGNETLFRRVGGLLVHPQLSFSTSSNINQPSTSSKEWTSTVKQPRLGLNQSRHEEYSQANRNPSAQVKIALQSKYESCKRSMESHASFASMASNVSSQNIIEAKKRADGIGSLKTGHTHDSNIVQGHGQLSSQERDVINSIESQSSAAQLNNNEEQLHLGFYQDAYQLDNY